ncbi:MAG: helix-turn-helix domain-containing protein [Duncaniella sp.]|nr:helix-turn-helix domain-containing protein [Duncaniella sp.]
MIRRIFYLIFIIALLAPGVAVSAKEHGDRARLEEYLRSHPNDVDSLVALAHVYIHLHEYELAQEMGNRLLEMGRKQDNWQHVAMPGLVVIGYAAALTGQQELAYRSLTRAQAIAQSVNDHDALASVFNGLALYETTFSADPYAAISYYYQGLEHAKAAGNTSRYAMLLGNLSQIYIARSDLSGMEYARQAYELAKRHGYQVPLYYASLGLAQYYTLDGRLDPAWDALQEARHLAALQGRNDALELDLLEAYYRSTTGQPEQAVEICTSTLNDTTKTLTVFDRIQLLTALGEAQMSMGQPNKALHSVHQAMSLSKESGVMFQWPTLLKLMASTLSATGDYPSAVDYLEKYAQYNDSVQRIDRERALIEARIRHEVREQEDILADHRRQLSEDRRQLFLVIVFAVILLGVLAAMIASYRRKNRLYDAIVRQNLNYIERENSLLQRLEQLSANASEPSVMPAEESATTKEVAVQQPSDVADAEPEAEQSGEPEGEPAETQGHTAQQSPLMARFTTLMMQEHLYRDPSLTIATVAERLGTNRTYLSRAINESTGRSFPQMLTELRVRDAVEMMSEPGEDRPIKQISALAGFSALSTFYAAFQEATGMTPARYRAQVRKIDG